MARVLRSSCCGKYGSPPDKQLAAIERVLKQATTGTTPGGGTPAHLTNPHLHRPSDDPQADVLIDVSDH